MATKQSYKDLSHPRMRDTIHSHIFSTLKLVKLVADFAHKISLIVESSVNDMNHAIGDFKKRSAELCKHFDSAVLASSSVTQVWEALLTALEVDAQKQSDFAAHLNRLIYNRLLEQSLYKKLHISQLGTFSENAETLVSKARETLQKTHDGYKSHCVSNGGHAAKDGRAWESCVSAHNDYVLQLCATNELIRQHSNVAAPSVLEDLEGIQLDTSNAVKDAVQTFASLTVAKAKDQCSRYEHVFSACKRANAQSDLIAFVGSVGSKTSRSEDFSLCPFSPIVGHVQTPECLQRCEIIFDKSSDASLKAKRMCLQKEHAELLTYAEHCRDVLRSLEGQYQRHRCDQNYTKCYELQSDISKQKSNMEVSAMRLRAVSAQIALLCRKPECAEKNGAESITTENALKTSRIKEMWKKFAIKATGPIKVNNASPDKSVIESPATTYGSQATSSSQSELGTGIPPRPIITITGPTKAPDRLDGSSPKAPANALHNATTFLTRMNESCSGPLAPGEVAAASSPPLATASVAAAAAKPKPNPKLLGMKSFSLESPDVPRSVDPSTRSKSSSYTNASSLLPSRPGALTNAGLMQRRLAMAKGKSASIDESDVCHWSEAAQNPRDDFHESGGVFIVVKDFKPKKQGDLELRAGQSVTVYDVSDPEWWLGRCNGRSGFFSSACVMSLYPGQRVFRVEKPLHLNDGGRDVRLAADQIVVEAGKEEHGVIMIKTHNSKAELLSCPTKYLIEL